MHANTLNTLLGSQDVLPPSHLRVLGVLLRWAAAKPWPPTIRDIVGELGHQGVGSVERSVGVLKSLGLVTQGAGARTLRPSVYFVPADQLATEGPPC